MLNIEFLSCLDTMTSVVTNSPLNKKKKVVTFDFIFSKNYRYIHDFENVKRIIRGYELKSSTKFYLIKGPEDLARRGEIVIILYGSNKPDPTRRAESDTSSLEALFIEQ